MIPAPFNDVKNKQGIGPTATLESPVKALKGVGPQRLTLFKRLGIETIRDLVTHFPKRHEDRRAFLPIARLVPGQKQAVRGRIASLSLFRAKTGTVIFQMVVKDAAGSITAIWFNQPYMRRWFSIGQELILYGNVEQAGRRFQMMVPEFEMIPQTAAGEPVRSLHMGRLVPIYPATSGLHQRELRNAIAEGLKAILPVLKDPVPPELLSRHRLLDLATALKRIHFPPVPEAVEPAQARLSFDELLCFQLALEFRRKNLKERPGISHQVGGDLVERWKARIPFSLTAGQQRTMEEIAQDMAAGRPMHRLLQGEVGSGKTVVAAYAMVIAAQNRFQSAVMAPTEVLARQHALTLTQLLSPIDLSVGLLTGSMEKTAREFLLQDLRQGSLSVLVGTHALLEPEVAFSRLGLVVIDEQQKFGVRQRNTLVEKGASPDLLILTATPIPRTLALTLYGEMEISAITERPAGRQTVRTLWMDSTRRQEVYAFVRKELEAGRQAFVVCPRIGGAEAQKGALQEDLFEMPAAAAASKVANVTELVQEYQEIFTGFRVALLHGRMTPQEQKEIFASFKRGEIQVLVATQIIEVGVDIPNATVMVIEAAQRFGLSQLHQLRGRVGRGRHEGTCILMGDPKDTDGAQRLQTLVEVSDAFKISEEDLRLRGPGELLGKRQAGLPDLKCLQWASQGPWMEVAREEARRLLSEDVSLPSPEMAGLKREAALRFPQLAGGCA